MVDLLDVERRILRACKTIRALPDADYKFQYLVASLWPTCPPDAEKGYGYNDVIMPGFRPTPADVSDCLIALAWARGMPKRQWKLIVWRSLGWTDRQIAARLGRSHETARQWYKDAILAVWYEANRQQRPLYLVGGLDTSRDRWHFSVQSSARCA